MSRFRKIEQMENTNIVEFYFKEFNIDSFCSNFFKYKFDNPEINNVIDNFKYNVISTITNMRIPFLFSISHILQNRWKMIAIESGLEVKDKSEIDKLYYEWLAENWEENLDDINKELIRLSKDHSIDKDILVDNLLQGAVRIWTSFEVLNKDLITILLNTNPNLISDLIENIFLKKRIKEPDFETLMNNEFNMSNSLGVYVFSDIDFSNYNVILNINKALFENIEIKDCLYELNQIRHIVVHKSGIIDKKFVDSSSTKQNVGEKLNINVKDIRGYLSAVKEYLECMLLELKNKSYIKSKD